MSLKITISDIARELSVTPATVSRALNNHPGISDRTKERVAEAVQRLNYKPNKIASSLRSGRTNSIGVLIPSAQINFFGSVIHGIESLANQHGFSILIYQTNESRESEVKGLETFIGARVDGVLASISKDTLDYSHFLHLKEQGVPLVFFDRANDELGISSVVVDDYKGAYMATEHLIRQGYQRIAHISGPSHIKIFNDRLKGYLGALQANYMPVDEQLICRGNVSIEAGKEAIRQLLRLPERPDALFAVEDFTALGAIKVLKDEGIRMPEEFGIIGFANELFGEHITPSLSTIDQQTVKMGEESFLLLQEMIQGGKAATVAPPKKVTLNPTPVFRQSSMRNGR